MREEHNAELLRKIRCCEAGEVLGRILMYIFFFATILYLVIGKVYKPVKYMIEEIYLNLKNKKNRKFQLWLIIAILGGMVGIGEYSVCYVKANSVVEDVIEGDTEDAEEIEVKTNPKLAIYSEQWVEGKGDFTNYLFSRENRFITLQLEEKAFEEDVEDEEEGEFLFQVSEKRENLSKITNYEKKDFIKSNEEQPIYQKILNFEGEEGEEKLYDVSFKYINKWGLPLIGIEGQENQYGEIISGLFKSKKLVLDRKCPEIKEIQIEKAGEVGNTIKKKYFNGSIKGTVNIKETYLDFDSVHIWAMPLDEKAKKLTEQAEGRNNESGVDILSWKHTKEKDSIQISFNFFMEGKWKFYFNCLDMAGNKGVSVTTQEQVAESEEFFIDNTAPKLKVSYTGRLNILDKESSLANVNKKIQNNKGKITSSQNQIFAKRDNEVIIEIKETNINPEDIEIKLYSIAYGADGELEETELSEKDLYNKIIRKINNPKSGSEWENEVVYSIRNLQDGHYKIRVYCEDKAGNRMIAEKNSETDRCLYNGWYQSPLYTIDTMPPIITEVYCNEAAVRKIGKRQYFRNAPQIIIRIQEENFNRGNFSLSGKLFYANGKSMDK